jgi:hypothetical protein
VRLSFCFTIRSLQLYPIMHPLSFIFPNMHFEKPRAVGFSHLARLFSLSRPCCATEQLRHAIRSLFKLGERAERIEKRMRRATSKQAGVCFQQARPQHTSRREMLSLLYFSYHARGEAKSASTSEFVRSSFCCRRRNRVTATGNFADQENFRWQLSCVF